MIETLSSLCAMMRNHGSERVYVKRLSKNDNSKNQIYLGSGFVSLNLLPHGGIYTDRDQVAGSRNYRSKAILDFSWVDKDGIWRAPGAQLVLYPAYPEVRFPDFSGDARERRPA